MNRFLAIIFLVFSWFISAGQNGWRAGEMEIKVHIEKPGDHYILRNLGFDVEIASPDGATYNAYLIPDELKKLESSGLKFTISISNLNNYYSGFWDKLVPPGYYTYEQIVAIADSLQANFPYICKKVIYGSSVGGQQLAALKISDNVDSDEAEPEIMFDGGIHGDEIGGPENLIRFARALCLGYGSNPDYTFLISNREIWIYYMVNPDGRVNMSRYNWNLVDCNRDAGFMWNGEGNSTGAFSQPESKALRQCLLDNQFVVYTNYHSGTEMISYPWSYRPNATPDNAHLNLLAGIYSSTAGYTPPLSYGQGYNIMYPINGSYKDFQYGSLGNVGWSIEISNNKQPPSSQIMTYYNNNVPAMIQMITRSGYGIDGTVTDSLTGNPIPAIVWVNNYYPVYTDPAVGDYHKYLLPGAYTVKVTANGYKPKTISNVIVPFPGAITVNFELAPDTVRYAYKVLSCQIPNNNFGDPGFTPGSLGAPDNIPYALGRNGWIVLDMFDTVYNGTGNDIRIYEANSMSRGYTVYASQIMDGPWSSLGTGTGTMEFDLSVASLNKARYLKIKDDGDGPGSGPGIGFNLDAVQMLTMPVIVDFNASSNTPCIDSTVTFTDQSTGNLVSWNWIFPGGTPDTSSQQDPGNIVYTTPGNYDVTLIVSNGASYFTRTKNSFISASASLAAPSTPEGPDTVYQNDISLYTTIPSTSATAYSWELSPSEAGIISGSWTTGTVDWDDSYTGTAYIKVAGINACGMGLYSDSLSVEVLLFNGIPLSSNEGSVSIYPNPSGGIFHLDIHRLKGVRIRILTFLGSEILTRTISSPDYNEEIDMRGYPGGLYILEISNDHRILTKKLILQ